MINFSSVVIKDFLNIKHREVRLDTPGLTLVVGKNGTGKSAQYSESLAWALFGQTIRPLTADEVIRKDQPSCQVAVLLNVEGQEYVVERKKSRGKAADLNVYVGGSEDEPPTHLFPSANMAEKQGKLERWLGLDFTAFTNSVVFGQGLAALFASSNLSDADRKAIFDRIYGLEEYDAALAAVLADHAVKGASLSLHKATVETTAKALAREQDELQKAAEAAGRWLENHEAEVAAKFETAKVATTELTRCVNSLEAAQQELGTKTCPAKVPAPGESEFKELLKEQRVVKESCKSKLDEVTINVKASQREFTTLGKALKTSTCPTCGQELKSAKVMEEREQELVGEITRLEECEADLRAAFNDVSVAVTEIEREVAGEEAVYRAALTSYMGQKEAYDKAVSAVSLAKVRLEGAQAAHDRANKDYGDAKVAENPFEAQVVERASRVETLEQALTVETEAMEKLDHEVKVLTFWKNGFGAKGIKGFLLETLLPEFNRSANDHLFALSDGSLSMEVKAFTTLKKGTTAERMTVNVINEKGAEVYNGNSGGERRRIDLAILLALQELVSKRATQSINFGVYDEVLDALDTDGIARVVDHLKKLSVGRPTFVISHSADMRQLFDDVVVLEGV